MNDLDQIRDDLAAFADDDEGYELDEAGDLLLHRGGVEINARISHTSDGSTFVEIEDQRITYRDFIVRELGQMDILATRLLDKRSGVDAFVNAVARVETADGDPYETEALNALHQQCVDAQGFRARVCFLTADAGQGKTALLREFQARNAAEFLTRKSPFVFWHVDLQGRQLLRLSEALMGDLGDLRVAGLWMPAIIRLIRSRALVLAIDGFDELAAEQGGSDALGSLATLVQQMDGTGVVVAASRRAFFDTGDYLRRAGMFGRAVAEPCEFNQLNLLDWTQDEAHSYLGKIEVSSKRFDRPARVYEQIIEALGGSNDHPMVTKPFLLYHVARWLLVNDASPIDFIMLSPDARASVANVVEAYVGREVTEKWRYRDSGEPYLTREQHIQLLADVAEEMYRAGKDRLPLDVVETLAALRLEEWNIPPDRQRHVMKMVRMHALLQAPGGSPGNIRAFDHPEFRDYFVAIALKNHIENLSLGDAAGASDYLSIAQLSDSTARYARNQLPAEVSPIDAAVELARAADRQIRSTFLQVNAGTLIPALINGLVPVKTAKLVGRVVYSSLVFENSVLTDLVFERATFLNVTLRSIQWTSLRFEQCELGELSLHDTSDVRNVSIRNCSVEGVKYYVDGKEIERAYAPSRVRQLLIKGGFSFEDEIVVDGQVAVPDTYEIAVARRLLQSFTRSNAVTDEFIRRKYSSDQRWIIEELIPIFERNEVLAEKTWRGSGSNRIWVMKYPLEAVLEAEEREKGLLANLWNDLRTFSRK